MHIIVSLVLTCLTTLFVFMEPVWRPILEHILNIVPGAYGRVFFGRLLVFDVVWLVLCAVVAFWFGFSDRVATCFDAFSITIAVSCGFFWLRQAVRHGESRAQSGPAGKSR